MEEAGWTDGGQWAARTSRRPSRRPNPAYRSSYRRAPRRAPAGRVQRTAARRVGQVAQAPEPERLVVYRAGAGRCPRPAPPSRRGAPARIAHGSGRQTDGGVEAVDRLHQVEDRADALVAAGRDQAGCSTGAGDGRCASGLPAARVSLLLARRCGGGRRTGSRPDRANFSRCPGAAREQGRAPMAPRRAPRRPSRRPPPPINTCCFTSRALSGSGLSHLDKSVDVTIRNAFLHAMSRLGCRARSGAPQAGRLPAVRRARRRRRDGAQIAEAAGQKNHAAVGYHFGSKEALIRELVLDGARVDRQDNAAPSTGWKPTAGRAWCARSAVLIRHLDRADGRQ